MILVSIFFHVTVVLLCVLYCLLDIWCYSPLYIFFMSCFSLWAIYCLVMQLGHFFFFSCLVSFVTKLASYLQVFFHSVCLLFPFCLCSSVQGIHQLILRQFVNSWHYCISFLCPHLHQNPSFRLFNGEDPSYSALEFLNSCEDAINNSNVTDGKEKFSFVRCNLNSEPEAARMMSAAAFDSRKIKNDYVVFKRNWRSFWSCPAWWLGTMNI